jgi:hypothetical protein
VNREEYRVEVAMEPGENPTIFKWDDAGEADYLVTRMLR